jgi:hypothetical protein
MVIEKVFVSSTDLACALDPSGGAPANALRRLRESGLISHGISLRTYRDGRLRGRTVAYCALNIDAVESIRDGDERTAHKLARAASAIESTLRAQALAKTLAGLDDLRQLDASHRRAAWKLAARITHERNRLAHGGGPMLGVVVSTDETLAEVETNDETVFVPRETLGVRGLDLVGTPVAIRSHRLRTGALVHSADEALALDDDRAGAREYDPSEMRRERRSSDLAQQIEAHIGNRRAVRLVAPLAVAR